MQVELSLSSYVGVEDYLNKKVTLEVESFDDASLLEKAKELTKFAKEQTHKWEIADISDGLYVEATVDNSQSSKDYFKLDNILDKLIDEA